MDAADVRQPGAGVPSAAQVDGPVGAPWTQTHIPPLDGLRGIAILLVLLHHQTLYRPTEGRILWDGVDIAAIDPERWRTHVAMISQQVMRWPFTAEMTIRLGRAS